MGKKEIINEIKQQVADNKAKEKPKQSFFSKYKILIMVVIIIIIATILILTLSSSKNLKVIVINEQGMALKDVNVSISYNNYIDKQVTDAFGEATFSEIKAGKVQLKVEKQNYITSNTEVKLSKNKEENITLKIDNSQFENIADNTEKRRNIIFKSFEVLVTEPLNLTFKCATNLATPTPSTTTISTGTIEVVQPVNCGKLLVSVTSTNYALITNQEVPESNLINLASANANTGMLEVLVKGITGQAIPYANLKIHNIDNPATPIDESAPTHLTNTADQYGKYKFLLTQGSYLVSADKQGYIISSRLGPHTVINNSINSIQITLFTSQDLENINCSNPVYSSVCTNGVIDCNSPLLAGLVIPNPTGTGCVVGKLTNLTIKLKDQNTNVPIVGNISLYRRDLNVSTLIGTRVDVNQTTFSVIQNKNYRVVVSGTEDNGYVSPSPRDINSLIDGNNVIEIPLEYSSALNSGNINTNVSKEGYDRANALVYLFYELDDEYILYNPETPKITNFNGDANFDNVRSGRDYYAYAILRNENADGSSSTERLDSNSTLELGVLLNNQSKTINLKVNPNQDYNFVFYDVTGDEIPSSEIISTKITGDINNTFVFSGGYTRVYAKIIKGDIIYQTDLMSLFPNQVTYKEITFPTSLSNIQTSTEYLGMYDSTGTVVVPNISYTGNNDITKEYKLKFKTIFGAQTTDVLKKAFIRAGGYAIQNDDYIYITNTNLFVPEDAELINGCRYAGDLENWNNTYFNTHYSSDYSANQCPDGKFKWVEFDFSELESNIIEYSVNIRFKNEITNTSNYKIYYRSINSNMQAFAFSPANATWQNWSIVPEGYFYAPSTARQIPFDNINYSYLVKLSDSNGELTKFGSDYILYIDTDYNYTIDFTQFNENNRTGDIVTSGNNTIDNLRFTRSYFKDRVNPNFSILNLDNNLSVTIPQKATSRGYYFTNTLITKPTNFFSITGQPSIKTQLFKSGSSVLDTATTNVLSYSQSEYVPYVVSQASDGNIYLGENLVTIGLKNRTGQFENGISVKYILSEETVPTELGQITNGSIQRNIFIQDIDAGKTITFIFTVPNSTLPNNEISYSSIVTSGIEIYNLNNQLITNENRLRYSVIITTINNIRKTSAAINNYIIKKKTSRSANLDSINVSTTTELLSEEIDDYLAEDNTLPKNNLQTDTAIIARILVDEDTTVNDINFNYNNLITLQNTTEDPITICKDVNANVKIKRFTIIDSSQVNPPQGIGYYSDNTDLNIELIETVARNVSVPYSFNLTSPDINKYSVSNIRMIGENPNNQLTFSSTNTISPTTTGLSGNMTFNFTLSSASVSQIIEKDMFVQMDIGDINESFVYEVPVKVKIYPKNQSYQLTAIGAQNQLGINCKSESDCNSTKEYVLKNKTKSYNMNLSTIQVIQGATPLTITPQAVITGNISPSSQLNVPILFDGNYNNLITLLATGTYNVTVNKTLTFNIEINSNAVPENKQIKVIVNYSPDAPDVTLNNIGITGNFCLGVGAEIKNDGDYFILGSCKSESQEACLSGEAHLPKVLYDWGQSTTTNWQTLCISTEEDYNDTGKVYCDSVQALYSIFTLIGNSTHYRPLENNYYIYLMSDGVSTDLLADFKSGYNQFGVHNINENFIDAYLSNSSNNTITINKINSSGQPTIAVGKYQIVIDNYNSTFTSDMDIKLKLVQNIPLNKNSLFYYLPFDGEFGLIISGNNKATHRIGYGSTIIGQYDYEENININGPSANNSIIYKPITNCPTNQDCSGLVNINARYPTSYLTTWQVQDVLNSNGTLLDLAIVENNETNKINVNFNFIPSRPINIFAKVSGISDSNFNYRFKNNEDVLDWKINIFKWKDHTDRNYSTAMEDNPVTTGSFNTYLRHTILKSKFNTKYGNSLEDNYLLESRAYFPVNSGYTAPNLKISLSDIDNNSNSRLYGLENINGSTEQAIKSRVPDIYSITQLLNQVREGNACITQTLTTTKIRWVENKVFLPTNTKDQIIQNYNASN